MNPLKTPVKSLCLTLATVSLTALAPAAFAAGSGSTSGSLGGGANRSTPTTKQYDPVKDYQSGIAYLKAEDYKKADKKFKRVLSATSRHAPSNYYMGIAKVGQAKDKSAIRYFKNAIRYQDGFYEASAGLGKAYAVTGKTEKAQSVLTKLQTEAATCGTCGNAERINNAIADIETALAGGVKKTSFLSPFGPDALDKQYFASVSLINKGQYQAAFNDLSLTSAAAGPHPDITTYMGYTQRKMGNYKTAKNYYALALAVDPNHKGANEYLGELYVEIGEMDLAKQQLAKLETICTFGCIEENELRAWITDALP